MAVNVLKRDGSVERFSRRKVYKSIEAAVSNYTKTAKNSFSLDTMDVIDDISDDIEDLLSDSNKKKVTSQEIEDLIEDTLVKQGYTGIMREYVENASERRKSREMNSVLMNEYKEIAFKSGEESDMKRENANIDSDTAMGQMLEFGSRGAKNFYLNYIINKRFAKAHINGDIHIHDLDFYSMTLTCCQIPLAKILKNGFNTGHGYEREPGRIGSAAALTAIVIQSDQNDQHGGQSIPMLDYDLAPYVSLSYVKNLADIAYIMYDIDPVGRDALKNKLVTYHKSNPSFLKSDGGVIDDLYNIVKDFLTDENIRIYKKQINKLFSRTYEKTYNDTYQAMEALVHNLNTMHSRAGSQVPFSSINFGTDTSVEGRMVSECLLLATEAGLGHGEIPIFPISIFKLKNGVNYNKEDTNYDLFKLACRVSAKRLYPNFVNDDATYNAAIYKEGHPETEVATMGCRTRVATNVYDPNNVVVPGRGNISFTSINLPRLGILANHNIDTFYESLDNMMQLVHDQLLERLKYQGMRHPTNFPFLMGQGVWLDSDKLAPGDDLIDIIKHGTLTVGFIGLAETLVALTGKHHGESEASQKLGLEIVRHMRKITDDWSRAEGLNYSVIGTPAEGLSGRFTKIDRKRFGIIPGVTDKEYYTNSSHIPVNYKIKAFKKIDIEAPYHEIENGGHILYIEMDGDPTKNLKAFEKVVRYMHDKNAGYFAINHPVDRDPICGYVGIIGDVCPRCGRREGEAMTTEMWRKIYGYANAGNADTLGACGDPNEEGDRLTNDVDDTDRTSETDD